MVLHCEFLQGRGRDSGGSASVLLIVGLVLITRVS